MGNTDENKLRPIREATRSNPSYMHHHGQFIKYVSSIHSYLTQERRWNKFYTELEVAAHMVQQAKGHPEYQLLAGAYMAQIIAMPTDQNEMSPEFHTDNLALNFESNKQETTLPYNPTVNKFG